VLTYSRNSRCPYYTSSTSSSSSSPVSVTFTEHQVFFTCANFNVVHSLHTENIKHQTIINIKVTISMIYTAGYKMGATIVFMITLANTDQFKPVAKGS